MQKFLQNSLKNIQEIFSPKNLIWHFLAIILTFIIVQTNFDWNYFVFMQEHSFQSWFWPAVVLGGEVPFLTSLILIILSKEKKESSYLLKIGLILLEATILAILISGFYKALTGRVQPPHSHDFLEVMNVANLTDSSHNFNFGFWRKGVFWGWPSTHTTMSFAFSVALFYFFPKNKKMRFLVIFYAFYVGIGVSITAIHWFSEFIAGAIIGSVIGKVVSKNNKTRYFFKV